MSLRRSRLWLLLWPLLLAGCNDLGYYTQAVRGQLAIVDNRRPIAELLAEPSLPAPLKERLRLVLSLRDFASAELALPDNGSFRGYTVLAREAAVWNVVATPELSLTPRTWCFPVAGCVPYRGYFAQADAEVFAVGLRASGDDVSVYAVPAYSTLGWFDDPVLSSFIDWPEPALAGLLFHELAHQQLYLKGDAPFAEAFARTVEEEGVARWLTRSGDAAQLAAYASSQRRRVEFAALLRQTRSALLVLYASRQPEEAKRRAKVEIFADLRTRYAAQRLLWGGYAGYDRWFAAGLNNARLAAGDTYEMLLPALRELLHQQQGDLPRFYRAAAELAALAPDERRLRLAALTAAAGAD